MCVHARTHTQWSFRQLWRTKLYYFTGKWTEPSKNQPDSQRLRITCFQSCEIHIKDIKIKSWTRKAIKIEKREKRYGRGWWGWIPTICLYENVRIKLFPHKCMLVKETLTALFKMKCVTKNMQEYNTQRKNSPVSLNSSAEGMLTDIISLEQLRIPCKIALSLWWYND